MQNVAFRKYQAVIFARYNSSRLPGKVLFTLGNKTIIGLCVEKLRQVKDLRVVVATSEAESDNPIAEWCGRNGVTVFRGALDQVALRTISCLQQFPCEAFFRINADSPFLQVDLLKQAIQSYETGGFDIVSNVVERSYPCGVAVELIDTKMFLEHAPKFQGDENEHITSYFYKRKDDFNIAVIKQEQDQTAYRFVLDTPDDWKEIQELYNNDNQIFNYSLQELIQINKSRT